ncbi:S-adenosylhomocysteine deaminase [candidate division TA06 bacterium B3_TA06]|uniref:5-methylthioadenosine/S-adenosylhomocysteine deaminase n=1 Tax=candidate division TA06 bacterium B3_TA06 TaxID=2012487 RepID=A0A532V6M4_UNCT6|nr:MAG: S-adenosylhomocysteine deaminase [candidate division TA06 bacterium B3_TA06]
MVDADRFLLTARYVVSMDKTATVYSPGYVSVEEGKIKSVGSLEGLQGTEERIDYGNAAIIPGLINSHTHAAMTLLRGVADDLPLDDWLEGHIWPLEAKFLSPEFIRAGTRLAAIEMLKGGTTLFADMYFFEDEVAAAARDVGIRVLIGEGILAFPTVSAKKPGKVFDHIRRQVEKYRDDKLVRVHIAAHSTYATSEDQLGKCVELSEELNLPIKIHCAESRKEVQESIEKHGRSQVAYLNDLGLLDTQIRLVHMVWPQDGDWDLLKRDNVSVVSCPQSNLKLGAGIPPIARYLDEGIRISLGTDGAASNNNLDMWEELRLAAFLVKGTSLDPTKLPARQALRMVTIDAARIWGMDEGLGSLEPGKKADLIVVDLSNPHTTPTYDIYSTLVYAAGAADVRDVFVAGRRVVKKAKITTLDEESVLGEARDWAERITQERRNV